MEEVSSNNDEDWRVQSENYKNLGNEAFQKGDNEIAIDYYSRAIDLDPENHVFYSNRSAAYMKHDSISKALKDAEKCVELAPTWSKGYNRLGAAQQGLKRFEAAIESFKKSIELDSSNQSLWSALTACKEAYEADKNAKNAQAAIERAQEEERLNRLNEIKQEIAREKKQQKEENDLANFFDEVSDKKDEEEPTKTVEDDLLAGFFTEVLKPKEQEQPKQSEKSIEATKPDEPKDEKSLTAKYVNTELGTGPEQVARILSSNYKWKNLNPYYVLQLDIDATEEDIKYRYKKLSAKVHPDKLIGIENAREAFEEVKNAYNKLLDESQKKVIILNIEGIRDETTKERRKLIAKGTKESTLPSLEDEISKKTMKAFADMEMAKRRSENNARSYTQREKNQNSEQIEKLKAESKQEEAWNDLDRREKRVGDWRSFAKVEKKAKVSNYNVEQRDFARHGKVFVDGTSHKV